MRCGFCWIDLFLRSDPGSLLLTMLLFRGGAMLWIGSPRRLWKVVEICLCSRALREAVVSRANRGILVCTCKCCSRVLDGECGVLGTGVSTPLRTDTNEVLETANCDWPSLLRRLRGAPLPIGSLVNLASAVSEVGRSSKLSSSEPSPQLRRRSGRLIVFLAWAARSAMVYGLRSLTGVCGRRPARRERDLCAAVMLSPDPSESLRRLDLVDLRLTCCDCAVDTPAGKKGAVARLSAPMRDSDLSGERGRSLLPAPSCRDGGRGNAERIGEYILERAADDLFVRRI